MTTPSIALQAAQRLRRLADRERYVPLKQVDKDPDLQTWIEVGEIMDLKPNANTQKVWERHKDKHDLDVTVKDLPGFPDTLEVIWGTRDDWYVRATYQGKDYDFYAVDHAYEDTHFPTWPLQIEDLAEATLDVYRKEQGEILAWGQETLSTALKEAPEEVVSHLQQFKVFYEVSGLAMTFALIAPLSDANHPTAFRAFADLTPAQLRTQYEARERALREAVREENQKWFSPLSKQGLRWLPPRMGLELQEYGVATDPDAPPKDDSAYKKYEYHARIMLRFPEGEHVSFSHVTEQVSSYKHHIGEFRKKLASILLKPWEPAPGNPTGREIKQVMDAFQNATIDALDQQPFVRPNLSARNGRLTFELLFGVAHTPVEDSEAREETPQQRATRIHRLNRIVERRLVARLLPEAQRTLAKGCPGVLLTAETTAVSGRFQRIYVNMRLELARSWYTEGAQAMKERLAHQLPSALGRALEHLFTGIEKIPGIQALPRR